jgi:hypothetical protein
VNDRESVKVALRLRGESRICCLGPIIVSKDSPAHGLILYRNCSRGVQSSHQRRIGGLPDYYYLPQIILYIEMIAEVTDYHAAAQQHG